MTGDHDFTPPYAPRPSELPEDGVKVMEVIVTTNERRGNGRTTTIRKLTRVYTKDGTLIAEHDPCPNDGITDTP